VYHVTGRETTAGGDDGLARRKPSLSLDDAPALLQYGWPSGAVYGAVHPAASHEAGVGGVHDGINLLAGNVALDEA
jgi:hypothetical protein